MNGRRLAALGAMGLLAVGVVALLATDTDDTADAPDTGAAAESVADEAGEPTPPAPPAPDAADPAGAGDDRPSEPDAVPLRYDPALVPELPDRGPHPPLVGIDGWQQSDVESLEELRGSVVAVQFWTFGCSNCKATMPHLAALYEKYGGNEFEIVGVHAPEFDRERDPDRIAAAATELAVTWPIALDADKETFRTWQTGRRFWPRIYLLDRDGNVRYDKIGEGRYDEIDAAVGALLDEPWDADLAAELEEWVERDVDQNSDPM